MTLEIAIVYAILAAAMLFFFTGWLRMDVTALAVLVALALTGLLRPEEAFSGFSSHPVIAVLGIFLLSAGLERTGVGGVIERLLFRIAGTSERRLTAAIMVSVALMSSIMNNVAATALLMPVVVGIARRVEIAPSRLLLPLAYGSIIGGMMTQIGTPPNIIVSGLLRERELPLLRLFDFTPVGAGLLLLGIVYMITLGRRLLPTYSVEQRLRQANLPSRLAELYQVKRDLHQLRIAAGSPLIGLDLIRSRLGERYQLNVIGILRGEDTRLAPGPGERLRAGDRLLITAAPESAERIERELGVAVERVPEGARADLISGEIGLVEAAVAPRSRLEGKTLREVRFRERYGITVVGHWRVGKTQNSGIADLPLQVGDALLLQGTWEKILLLRGDPDLILLSEVERPQETWKAAIATLVLIAAMAPVFLGVLPLSVGALSGGLAMILTRCLPVEEAYRRIEWRVIFLMAGLIPLGLAMQKTGGAELIASNLVVPLARFGPAPLLVAVFLASVALGLTTSSTISALLMAPIALDAVAGLKTAGGMDIDPRPIMLAVAYGSSTAFMTPIGNQSCVLVMGPGGYRFADFLRVGWPLTLGAAILVSVSLALA